MSLKSVVCLICTKKQLHLWKIKLGVSIEREKEQIGCNMSPQMDPMMHHDDDDDDDHKWMVISHLQGDRLPRCKCNIH